MPKTVNGGSPCGEVTIRKISDYWGYEFHFFEREKNGTGRDGDLRQYDRFYTYLECGEAIKLRGQVPHIQSNLPGEMDRPDDFDQEMRE
jgi:hypothetical protein